LSSISENSPPKIHEEIRDISNDISNDIKNKKTTLIYNVRYEKNPTNKKYFINHVTKDDFYRIINDLFSDSIGRIQYDSCQLNTLCKNSMFFGLHIERSNNRIEFCDNNEIYYENTFKIPSTIERTIIDDPIILIIDNDEEEANLKLKNILVKHEFRKSIQMKLKKNSLEKDYILL